MADAHVLARLCADRLQGYAFSRPMPLDDLLAQLEETRTSRSAF